MKIISKFFVIIGRCISMLFYLFGLACYLMQLIFNQLEYRIYKNIICDKNRDIGLNELRVYRRQYFGYYLPAAPFIVKLILGSFSNLGFLFHCFARLFCIFETLSYMAWSLIRREPIKPVVLQMINLSTAPRFSLDFYEYEKEKNKDKWIRGRSI